MDIQTLNKIGDSLRMLRARLSAEVVMAERQSDPETARDLRSELIDIQQQLLAVTAEVKAKQFSGLDHETIGMDITGVTFRSGAESISAHNIRATGQYVCATGHLTIKI